MKNLVFLPVLIVLASCNNSTKTAGEKENTELVTPTTITEDSLIIEMEEPLEIKSASAKIMFELGQRAYVDDPDTEPTNLREEPNGEVIYRLPQDYGYEVTLLGVSDGWFLVDGIWCPENEGYSKEDVGAFIHGSVLAVGTRNYGDEEIYLYTKPDETSKTVATIRTQVQLTLKTTNSDGSWVRVRWTNDGSTTVGWIQRKWICGSLETNCS